jgi:peroxiredoxin
MRGLVGAITGIAVAYGWLAAETVRPSPPFEIQRLDGPALRVSQYRGKIVALAFIDTTCPHCQELTGTLKGIVRDYAARGVVVLECAFNDGAKAGLPEFQQRFDPPFPVGWNTRAAVMSYLQYTILDPRPLYVPHMVFIDRGGAIRADYPGEDLFFRDPNTNIRAVLDKLLHGGRGAAPAANGKEPAKGKD